MLYIQVILLILMITFSSLDPVFHETSPNNIANAQQPKQQQVPPGVKITSHSQGQQVPTGTLPIEGMSTDTPTSTCNVYIILNSEKPYQKVFPTGSEARHGDDYSTWNYTFTPQYTTIQEGNNKMTSKITCLNESSVNNNMTNANLTKFNSLNVTGVTNANNNTFQTGTKSNGLILAPLNSSSSSTNITYAGSTTIQDDPSSTSSSGITPSHNLETEAGQIQDDPSNSINEGKNNTNGDTVAQQQQQERQDDINIGELKDRIFDRVEEQLKDEGVELDLS